MTKEKVVRVSDEVHRALSITKAKGDYPTMNDVIAEAIDINE